MAPFAEIACDVLPPLHQALVTLTDSEAYTFEVHWAFGPSTCLALIVGQPASG